MNGGRGRKRDPPSLSYPKTCSFERLPHALAPYSNICHYIPLCKAEKHYRGYYWRLGF